MTQPDTQPSAPNPSSGTRLSPNLPPQALAMAERLFDAARKGESETLSSALSHNSGINNLTNAKGDTLLMLASYHGHIELTRILVEQFGSDPNVLNDRGQTPLAGSVFKNEPEILWMLLENGADPDLGTPTAEECLKVFSLTDKYGQMFEEARQRIRVQQQKD